MGFRCENCRSYNTVRCGNEEFPEDAGRRENEGENNDGGRGRGGAVRMINAVLELARLRRQQRREQREREEESEEEDTDDESLPSMRLVFDKL